MSVKAKLQNQGQFLFTHRSYFPIAMLIPFVAAMSTMAWPLGSHNVHVVWEYVCLAVSLSGLVIRAIVVGHTPRGTSGRNTAYQLASQLNTTGLYSVVRHPLYLGNYLIALGPVLLPLNWWLPMVYTLAFALYYERIMLAEEAYLLDKFGTQFELYAKCTPAFLPNPLLWKRPSLSFSLRNVLRREYTAVAQIAVAFSLIEIAEHLIIDRKLVIEMPWMGIMVFGAIQYFVLRHLKRHTNLLDVSGR